MAREKLNTIVPAPKQLWEHVTTGQQLLVIQVEDDKAYCALMDGNKVSRRRVAVPVDKLRCYGNRGLMHVTNRKGKLPKLGDMTGYGDYHPRRDGLGAV